jgi:hypothetical protein
MSCFQHWQNDKVSPCSHTWTSLSQDRSKWDHLNANYKVVLQWLSELCVEFNFGNRTLMLAATIMIRALLHHIVAIREYQVLGASSLWLAAKIEEYEMDELYWPEYLDSETNEFHEARCIAKLSRDLVRLSDKDFKLNELLAMERFVLIKVWDYCLPMVSLFCAFNELFKASEHEIHHEEKTKDVGENCENNDSVTRFTDFRKQVAWITEVSVFDIFLQAYACTTLAPVIFDAAQKRSHFVITTTAEVNEQAASRMEEVIKIEGGTQSKRCKFARDIDICLENV